MPLRLTLALLLLCGGLLAETAITVSQLLDFVRSSLALKYDDRKIADYLRTVKLKDKLDQKTIESLLAQGAGPKTAKELEKLRDESASLQSAQPSGGGTGGAAVSMTANYKQPPPPNSVRQHEIIEAMRQYATTYTDSLPNFICVQVTERYVSFNGGETFRHEDRILTKLSYNGGQENYKVYQVNGQMVDTTLEKLGGAISSGEFGTLMKSLFSPKSQAQIGWDHWARLRGKVVAVFNYFIDSGHSDYIIDWERGAQRIVTAYRGLIYTDENTGVITRITFEAVDVPPSFPVREARTTLDYDDQKIGNNTYVLPLRALVRMAGPNNVQTKNEEQFTLYQKFGTESNITFEPEPLPEDKTKEEPVEDPAMKGLPPPPPR